MSKFLDETGIAYFLSKIKALIPSTYAGSPTAGGVANKSAAIPYGELDSTSTATDMTATVPGITELKDGVLMYLRNNVITSASGFTLNINDLGAKPVYSSLAAASRSTTIFNVNYTMMFIYNEDRVSGGCWDCFYGYDSNTNTIGYQLRTNSQSLPMKSITYRYRLLFTSADGKHFVPANNSTSTNATASRAVCQDKIDPFGNIYYYGTTASVAAGARPSAAYLWNQYTLSLGYSFNNTGAALTLTSWEPVYVKCSPQTDGSAIIDSTTPYVQTLPTTEDGYIYIFLGVAYSATSIELILHHPVYYFKDGQIRLYTNQIAGGGGGSTVSVAPVLTTGTNIAGITVDGVATQLYAPTIPSNISVFTNDAGYLTTETDPTVPAWAKASTKPTYDADEVGFSGTTGYITENATDVEMAINSLDAAVQNTVSSVNGASGDVVTTFYVIISGNATDGYTANKTFAEVESVIDAGYIVCAQYGTSIYHLILKTSAGMSFGRASSNQLATFTWTKSTNKINLVTQTVPVVSDVQVNGTSILSAKVANLVTNTAYNPSSNKIATMSDLPDTGGMIVNITVDQNGVYSTDKSAAEVYAAAQNYNPGLIKAMVPTENGEPGIAYLVYCQEDNGIKRVDFAYWTAYSPPVVPSTDDGNDYAIYSWRSNQTVLNNVSVQGHRISTPGEITTSARTVVDTYSGEAKTVYILGVSGSNASLLDTNGNAVTYANFYQTLGSHEDGLIIQILSGTSPSINTLVYRPARMDNSTATIVLKAELDDTNGKCFYNAELTDSGSGLVGTYSASYISGGGSGLPSVTTADNGKVLAVVNGAWASYRQSEVINKTAADTSNTLVADKFYIFPEMSTLSVTVTSSGMYGFRFESGATATTLTVTGATMPDSFTVEANKVYEINIFEGYGVVASWTAA